jgi:short-subunit dehydrogenase
MPPDPETVLVTGASSGIGRELARVFAANGSNLIVVARGREKLDELANELHTRHGVRVDVLPKDLSQPGAAESLDSDLRAAGLNVDVLVNNAGFGVHGNFAESDLKRQREMILLNILALTELARLLLPAMRRRARGGILNVASTAAFQPGPFMAVYYATKAYVLSFSEALADELRGEPVTITCLCPGPTRTGFASAADAVKTPLFEKFAGDAAGVARQGYRGFRQGKAVIIAGFLNKLGAFSTRFAPRWFAARLVRSLHAH